MSVRPAAKAGSWYDDNAVKLETQLMNYMDEVPETIDGVPVPVSGAKIVIAP